MRQVDVIPLKKCIKKERNREKKKKNKTGKIKAFMTPSPCHLRDALKTLARAAVNRFLQVSVQTTGKQVLTSFYIKARVNKQLFRKMKIKSTNPTKI
jgi:hypothetical protein